MWNDFFFILLLFFFVFVCQVMYGLHKAEVSGMNEHDLRTKVLKLDPKQFTEWKTMKMRDFTVKQRAEDALVEWLCTLPVSEPVPFPYRTLVRHRCSCFWLFVSVFRTLSISHSR